MNCQAGSENCEIEVDTRERGKTESDSQEIQPFHTASMRAAAAIVTRRCGPNSMTKHE
jgi:hypothetical protein